MGVLFDALKEEEEEEVRRFSGKSFSFLLF
jgi:hypothetical protein